jgi:16S rRNA (cytosine1402-N4)-methyltransferase
MSGAHEPVMLAEIVEIFATVPEGTILDATLGGAGHAVAILRRFERLRVMGVDRDPTAVANAVTLRDTLPPQQAQRFSVHHVRFDHLEAVMADAGVESLSGALFDLGVSSPQLDVAERGFSYRHDGPLDMRMDTTATISAADVVNGYGERELADVLRRHADERFAPRIARAIVGSRPIRGTAHLAEVVTAAIPAATRRTGGHPAKRTFQAIRIEVNAELAVLPTALDAALRRTGVGGRVAVLSYHSGEDRIVKEHMRRAEFDLSAPVVASPYVHPSHSAPRVWRKVRVPATPSDAEVARNPRAASARLRVMERVAS